MRRQHRSGWGRLAVAAALVICVAWSAAAFGARQTSEPGGAAGALGIFSRVWEWFLKGGTFMWPIALLSLVGVAFTIERAVALRHSVMVPDDLKAELRERMGRADLDGAMAACDAHPCPLASVVRAGLMRQWGTVQDMEKATEDAGVRELWHMRRFVRPIGGVASVAPLLGLLGTVSGLITAFDAMSSGTTMGNPSAFAGAIHEALYTTYLGLCVAIPMLLCFFWLRTKAEAIIGDIELVSTELLLLFWHKEMQNGREGPAGQEGVRSDAHAG